jgi:hypothetical protein
MTCRLGPGDVVLVMQEGNGVRQLLKLGAKCRFARSSLALSIG